MKDKWTEDAAPRQDGKVFVVTGANSGIGFEVSCLLAEKGADVVLACRSPEKAESALDALKERVPDAQATVMALDLADTRRIRDFVEALPNNYARIDGLVNNAGVMALTQQTTAQGFERQFGTNHLGHFMLTCLLLPRLADGGRVVTVSSEAHRAGKMHFDDLMLQRRYGRWKAYCQSKLANILFTRALQRRFAQDGRPATAAACHPGYSATALQGKSGLGVEAWFMGAVSNRLFAQSARMGALPTFRAACDPEVPPAAYVGPGGLFRARGYPVFDSPSPAARDDEAAERLWAASVKWTGVDWKTPGSGAEPGLENS